MHTLTLSLGDEALSQFKQALALKTMMGNISRSMPLDVLLCKLEGAIAEGATTLTLETLSLKSQ